MTIGFLCRGDLFRFDGKTYKVGRIIRGTDGYVACVDVETHKTTRFYIDTDVEKVERSINEH